MAGSPPDVRPETHTLQPPQNYEPAVGIPPIKSDKGRLVLRVRV
jgi:hypothetical protein